MATLGATVRGGRVELRGAALFTLAWIASLGQRALAGADTPGGGRAAIDLAVLVALAALAWKSPRPWPVFACGFQALALAAGLAGMVTPGLDPGRLSSLLAMAGFGAVGALAVGAWFPPLPRGNK